MKPRLHTPIDAVVIHIPIDGFSLDGELVIPFQAKGIVLFAHGSGSSRHSPRNMFVAQKMQIHSLATLTIDLLSEQEDRNFERRFDIKLLTKRLMAITDWIKHNKTTRNLAVGYFGASTGAAAALWAAAAKGSEIKAVVSRGGRVDLANSILKSLKVPTLLIVGQLDYEVLEVNKEAFLKLKGEKELAIIPKATHLFEEAGALERVAQLASVWFGQHLGKTSGVSPGVGRKT